MAGWHADNLLQFKSRWFGNIMLTSFVSHQYFFYMLVMTISTAEFSRNWFPYVNMSSRKPSWNFFALLPFQFAHVEIKTSLSQSYLASALLVCPSALKGKSTSVSKVSPMLGSGALRHFTLGDHQKAKKPPSATKPTMNDLPLCKWNWQIALSRATHTP